MAQFKFALPKSVVVEVSSARELDFADEVFAPNYSNYGAMISDPVHRTDMTTYWHIFLQSSITVDDMSYAAEPPDNRWSTYSRAPRGQACSAAGGSSIGLAGAESRQAAGGQIRLSWTSCDQAVVSRRLGLVDDTVHMAAANATDEGGQIHEARQARSSPGARPKNMWYSPAERVLA